MSVRTVRLDEESELLLQRLVQTTGLSISALLKQGLHALAESARRNGSQTPYEIYSQLDLGPGGYAVAPSTETRRGVREAIRRKLGR